MIYTNSVLRGYTASLGYFFLSSAFFFGSWYMYADIPSKEELETYNLRNIDSLFGLQMTVHLLSTILTILQNYLQLWKHLEQYIDYGNAAATFLMIIAYMLQC